MANLSSSTSASFESSANLPSSNPVVSEIPNSYELRQTNIGEREGEITTTWRSLFSFTTRQHAPAIVFIVLSTIASGALKPVAAIFFGYSFTSLSKYGSGIITAPEVVHEVSIWSIALCVLGVASWFFEGLFLLSWMLFGELQAKSVREKLFVGMLEKDMEWYDLREDGIGSLLIRIQT